MKKVSILLVDNPYFNITKIDTALKEAGLNYSLYFAGNGKNALDILMGDPYHELIASDDDKIKPNVVILSKELKDFPALDFLGIVSKYYSLKDVKIFLLSDSLTDDERFIYEELGVNGYLHRPLDTEQVVKLIKPQLSGGRASIALLPIALLRTKLAKAGLEMVLKGSVGAKIAASVASVLMIGSVAIYSASTRSGENLPTVAIRVPEQNIHDIVITEALPLPANEQEPFSGQEDASQRSAEPSQNSPEGESSVVLPQGPEISSQTNENSSPAKKPANLRIVAVEEPDSIPG